MVIPIGVLEELDKFKKEQGELGRNAREVCRCLDKLRSKGDLSTGVLVNEHNGRLRIVYNGNVKTYLKEKNIDLHVIYVADKLKTLEPDIPCIIVSKDINIRIRANALGLMAEDYECGQVKEEIDHGIATVKMDDNFILSLQNDKFLQLSDLPNDILSLFPNLYPNYYFLLQGDTFESDKTKNVMARLSTDMKTLRLLESNYTGMRIRPRNKEQSFVLDALMDDNIKLVTIIGKAGTGKTILATAAGYHMITKTNRYKKLLLSRPVVPMGRDIGYLPGDLNDKMDPWMQPLYDALEQVVGSKKQIDARAFIENNPNIKVEILTYIRGRSIQDQYFLLDEAQNLSPLEIKTIVTRAGEKTKVVMTGDIEQIDNPYLDRASNGLTIVTKAFMGSTLAAHIVMTKGVRSALAEEATIRI